MFIIIPTDVLNKIICLLDNNSNHSLILSSKYSYNHGKQYGYITNILLDYKQTYRSFLDIFNNNFFNMQTVEINGMDNPHIWLPSYKKNIIFSNCSINEYINPDKTALITKSLKIQDYTREKNKNIININWEKFINLEKLDLYVYNINLIGIEKLTKLKYKSINILKQKKRKLH